MGVFQALIVTKNAGVEAATDWLLEHAGDALARDLSEAAAARPLSPWRIGQLTPLGYNEAQVTAALLENDLNLDRAAGWLLNGHADQIAQPPLPQPVPGSYRSNTLQSLQP